MGLGLGGRLRGRILRLRLRLLRRRRRLLRQLMLMLIGIIIILLSTGMGLVWCLVWFADLLTFL
jgi:cell division septal protein FtsQ